MGIGKMATLCGAALCGAGQAPGRQVLVHGAAHHAPCDPAAQVPLADAVRLLGLGLWRGYIWMKKCWAAIHPL